MGNTLAPPNEEVPGRSASRCWALHHRHHLRHLHLTTHPTPLQVLAALHAVHNAGAAVNTLDPSRVLLTERGTRARISGAAVADVLRPEVQAAADPAVGASRDL